MVILDIKYPHCCSECELFDGEDLCYGDGTFAIADENVKPKWCPIKADMDEIKRDIIAARMYKGKSGIRSIDMHDYGLDRHFDMGLEKTLDILKQKIYNEILGEEK